MLGGAFKRHFVVPEPFNDVLPVDLLSTSGVFACFPSDIRGYDLETDKKEANVLFCISKFSFCLTDFSVG